MAPRQQLAATDRGATGRRTPPVCATGIASRPPSTGRPAIVATGRADAAQHGHAPGPTEPPGQEAPMLFSEICNLIVLGAVHSASDGEYE